MHEEKLRREIIAKEARKHISEILRRSRSKTWMVERRWTKRVRGKFPAALIAELWWYFTHFKPEIWILPRKLGFHCQQNCFHSWDCSANKCLQSAHPGVLWYRLHQTQPIKAMGINPRARNWAPAWLLLCRNENVSSQKKTHLRYNSKKIRNRPFDSRHANKSSSWCKNQLSCRWDRDSGHCCRVWYASLQTFHLFHFLNWTYTRKLSYLSF